MKVAQQRRRGVKNFDFHARIFALNLGCVIFRGMTEFVLCTNWNAGICLVWLPNSAGGPRSDI
jgi:hypothetical protein